ncbi:MAG: glycosyltransferase family 1 protein, partial [Acidimicrobiia bacterium]
MTKRLVHVTTTDMSLELLLGPQLSAFVAAGYEVIGASAPGRYVDAIEARGVRHVPLTHATRSMAPRDDVAAWFELRRLFV